MKPAQDAPPSVLDRAKVLAYAILDASVKYTGAVTTIFAGRSIGPVPRLAICRNDDEVEVLLFHCDEQWQVLGAGYFSTIEHAIEGAERQYRGSTEKWQHAA
jgi:hypothetical protein